MALPADFRHDQGSKEFADDPVAERFRRIFSTVRNHSRRGASFARVVQQVNRLHFRDETDVIVLSEIYEDLLKRVAGDRPATPASSTRSATSSARWSRSCSHSSANGSTTLASARPGSSPSRPSTFAARPGTLSGKDLDTLEPTTFFGVELKPLTYLLGTMNMLLHRIEGANLELANTLELHSANVSEKNKYDVILVEPALRRKAGRRSSRPTSRSVRARPRCCFSSTSWPTSKKGGRAAVIVPEGVLFRGGADAKVRERLLKEFDLHTVSRCPRDASCPTPA